MRDSRTLSMSSAEGAVDVLNIIWHCCAALLGPSWARLRLFPGKQACCRCDESIPLTLCCAALCCAGVVLRRSATLPWSPCSSPAHPLCWRRPRGHGTQRRPLCPWVSAFFRGESSAQSCEQLSKRCVQRSRRVLTSALNPAASHHPLTHLPTHLPTLPAALVTPGAGGQPPLLQLALGMAPGDAPLSPQLLHQATAADEAGLRLLKQVGPPGGKTPVACGLKVLCGSFGAGHTVQQGLHWRRLKCNTASLALPCHLPTTSPVTLQRTSPHLRPASCHLAARRGAGIPHRLPPAVCCCPGFPAGSAVCCHQPARPVGAGVRGSPGAARAAGGQPLPPACHWPKKAACLPAGAASSI